MDTSLCSSVEGDIDPKWEQAASEIEDHIRTLGEIQRDYGRHEQLGDDGDP